MKKLFLTFASVCLIASVYSCRETEKKADEAVDGMEEVMDDATDAAEEAAEKAGDVMDDATDAVEDAAEKTGDALNEAGDKLKGNN